jgi:hypothetical protein
MKVNMMIDIIVLGSAFLQMAMKKAAASSIDSFSYAWLPWITSLAITWEDRPLMRARCRKNM